MRRYRKKYERKWSGRASEIPSNRLSLSGFANGLIKIGLALGITCAINVYLGLRGFFFACNIIVVLLFMPRFYRTRRRNKNLEEDFRDSCLYMEQMLYAFKIRPKILYALEETISFFPRGQMHESIYRACVHIRKCETAENVYEEALKLVERDYASPRMLRLHHFLVSVEQSGGEYREFADMLLEDVRLFRERISHMQTEKQVIRNRIRVGFFIALGICGSSAGFAPEGFAVGRIPLIQGASVAMIAINLCVLSTASKRLANSWMKREGTQKEGKMRRYYLKTVQGKRSIGTAIARNVSKREIEKTFPSWLMDVALLLRRGNVQTALAESEELAPEVFGEAVKALNLKLQIAPDSPAPYMEFLEEYRLPSVQSAMKMLYGISKSGGVDAAERLRELLKQNYRMQNQAEDLKSEDSLGGILWLSMLPMATGSLKLMLDMVVFVAIFLGNLRF